jgi:hypothetical protein
MSHNGKTLEDYRRLVKVEKCRWCGTNFAGLDVRAYDHDGGWRVAGKSQRQWLYIHCRGCGYDWNLSKLGVPR